MHYQSTGSLHSDSQSSSSVSPIPMSPAPSPTRPNTANYLKPPTPIPSIPSTNLYNSKKWSSTGDFNQVQCVNITPSVPVNRYVRIIIFFSFIWLVFFLIRNRYHVYVWRSAPLLFFFFFFSRKLEPKERV